MRFSVSASLNALSDIANGKEYGILHNDKYGEIRYPLGRMGKGGFGLLHIVEQRMTKDGATLDEAINTAIRVGVSAQIGTETEQRHNTHHLDYRGTRAIIGEMPDKTIIITGYEIDTEESTGAKQRAAELSPRPHVRSEEVIRALKEFLASTSRSITNTGESNKGDNNQLRFSAAAPLTVASAFPRLDKLSDTQLISAAIASKTVFGKSGKAKNRYANVNQIQRYLKAQQPDISNLELAQKTQDVLHAVREISARMKEDLDRGVSQSQILQYLPDRMRDVFASEMTAGKGGYPQLEQKRKSMREKRGWRGCRPQARTKQDL